MRSDPLSSPELRNDPAFFGIGTLFQRVRDAVIVGDAHTGRIVLWNDAATRIFGYRPDEALGMLLEELVPEQLKAQHRQGLLRYVSTGRGPLLDTREVVELQGCRQDGSAVWVELTLSPLEHEPAERRYVLAIVRDVTERRQAEELLREALAREAAVAHRLRELDEVKNVFLAAVAHDLRSPMTAVAGFTNLLLQRWEHFDETERTEVLTSIARTVERCDLLVADVLDVATLEAGELPIALEPFDLGDVIRRTVGDMQTAHPGACFQLDVPTLPRVHGDPQRTWQILLNLLDNAVKFSPPDEPIDVLARPSEQVVDVAVRDRGSGIPLEEQESMFDLFARGAAGSTARVKGTGLGLYLCRRLAEAQGGEIRVESEPGHGATFTFTLQRADTGAGQRPG